MRAWNQLIRLYYPETLVSRAIGGMPSASGVVLMYHEVLPDQVAAPAWTVVRESAFRWQMEYLRRHFDVVDMDTALARINGNASGVRPFAVITFDDGCRGCLSTVLPIMEALGLPFVQYVVTGAILKRKIHWFDRVINLLGRDEVLDLELSGGGERVRFRIPGAPAGERRWTAMQRVLEWLKSLEPAERDAAVAAIVAKHGETTGPVEILSRQELQQLAASDLVSIGSHSHGHELLDRLDRREVLASLETSRRLIEEMIGTAPDHLSYPNGNHDGEVAELARECGYHTAVAARGGAWSSARQRYAIPRVGIGRFDGRMRFKRLLASAARSARSAATVALPEPGRSDRSDTPAPLGRPRRKKILFCIDSLARAGTELQMVGLITRLDRDRHAPYLFTLRASPDDVAPEDCPHLHWQVPRLISGNGLQTAWRLLRFLRRERFDVVQAYFPDATLFCGTVARLAGVPVRLACFRDLGFWRRRATDPVMRLAYRGMTGYLCNAAVVRDHFRAGFDLAPDRFSVIPNGIDVAALPWIHHEGPTRHVGLVGNMTRQVKRVDLFIQAAARVAARHPEVTWHIVGDGYLRPELEGLARTLGVGDRVVFAGGVEDVATYLEQLQVGVLCSDSEGFSNALLEYMFKGCAPVATAVGGNAEVLEDGVTGLLVPPDDVGALAAAISRLVEDPQFRQEIARNARAFVAERYCWESCVAAHEAVYERNRGQQ